MSDGDDKDDDKVKLTEEDAKHLRPVFGSPPMMTTPKGDLHCGHEYLAVQPGRRVVFCRVCRATIDPFIVVEKWARNWDHVTWLTMQQEEAQVRLDALKEEETRVKARLRGAYKKGEPEPKASVYLQELLAKLDAVHDYIDLSAVRDWAWKFKWLEPEQQRQLEHAYLRAEHRVKENGRSTKPHRRRKNRVVRVIKGGKE